MIIERTFDPAVVNAVSNHYSIFPNICGGQQEPLDASVFLEDQRNVYLAGEWGLAIFNYIDDGRYEAHYRVLPPGRGKWALGYIMIALQWMFVHPVVQEIRCRVPRGNYACKALVRRICFQFEFTMANGWIDEEGGIIEADIYSMTRERWNFLTQTRN